MGSVSLLIDFGSTFTKVVAVDLDKEEIISRAQVTSTVEEDITLGLKKALEKIDAELNIRHLPKREALACSSAAGGLRIVSIGFVPELTSEAATRAALGAGAKIVGRYSYELTKQELTEIEEIVPDIILLSGGTDGGDRKVIIHNADMLLHSDLTRTHILVAGNKAAYDEIKTIAEASGRTVKFTKNVMPEIGVLDIEPCNKEIREIYINNIIQAKGIAKAKALVKDIIMPTPSAVLSAAKLLAEGFNGDEGLGDLVIVDVGGATTDVHSVAKGNPASGAVVLRGLPEPYVKRTVEGDLGVRYSIGTLLQHIKERNVPLSPNFDMVVSGLSSRERLPETEEEYQAEKVLAATAVEIAVERHAGKIEAVYGPAGEMLVQYGKDLTKVGHVIGTGGPIVFSSNPGDILKHALFQEENRHILKPKSPKLYVDEQYILYAAGLLAQTNPKSALALMKKYLKRV
jgi:uncharacterized protein (TIGR01319 family)